MSRWRRAVPWWIGGILLTVAAVGSSQLWDMALDSDDLTMIMSFATSVLLGLPAGTLFLYGWAKSV